MFHVSSPLSASPLFALFALFALPANTERCRVPWQNWFSILGRKKSLVVRISCSAEMNPPARDINNDEHVGPTMISPNGFFQRLIPIIACQDFFQ
jgi:hypothetical protein